MEKVQNNTPAVQYTVTTFGAGKPVAPFNGRSLSNSASTLDPSSYLRADRYPIPNSFDSRSSTRERNL